MILNFHFTDIRGSGGRSWVTNLSKVSDKNRHSLEIKLALFQREPWVRTALV